MKIEKKDYNNSKWTVGKIFVEVFCAKRPFQ